MSEPLNMALVSDDGNNPESSSDEENTVNASGTSQIPIANSETGSSFDTNLPTAHEYMGDLDRVGSYTFFDDGEIIKLLGMHTNTLVLPGFTLPLVLKNYSERTKMENYLKDNNTFVLVCADVSGHNLFEYGVTMEVFEVFVNNSTLFLKAKGRQRCQIIGSRDETFEGRLQQITVKIYSEPDIISPIANSHLLSLKAHRCLCPRAYRDLKKNYKYRRYHLAQYPHPSWVYDQNEVCFYVEKIFHDLLKYFPAGSIPKDPVGLSYWFVQNLLLTHRERLHLLSLHTTVERLKVEYRLLQMNRLICCKLCLAVISLQNDIFVMSKDGAQSNYCNPDGHVYETLTVLKAKNYFLHSASSTKFSWFPGYAWTIMQCMVCGSHIGWQFTSNVLLPHKFFGLARSCMDIAVDTDYLSEDDKSEL